MTAPGILAGRRGCVYISCSILMPNQTIRSITCSKYRMIICYSMRCCLLLRQLDVLPTGNVASTVAVIADRDDRTVRFEPDRVSVSRRDRNDILPAGNIALTVEVISDDVCKNRVLPNKPRVFGEQYTVYQAASQSAVPRSIHKAGRTAPLLLLTP